MLEVRTRKLGEVSFYRLKGRIAVGETDGLLDTVLSQTDTKLVVLDLRRVIGIDAGGLGVLLELREQLRTRDIGFRLINVTNLVQQVLDITCLNTVFEVSSEAESDQYQRLIDSFNLFWLNPSMNKNEATEQLLSDVWDDHTRNEFAARNADGALATMASDAYVNHVPVLTGGIGREQVYDFYSKHFVPQMPSDIEIIPISRTISENRLVDELIVCFTHDVEMDWMLPGIPPTGKWVECATVAVVSFRDGKLLSEHIYWDQASVLVQLGLLDSSKLPVVGAETARKLADPASVPSNQLMRHANAARTQS